MRGLREFGTRHAPPARDTAGEQDGQRHGPRERWSTGLNRHGHFGDAFLLPEFDVAGELLHHVAESLDGE